MTMEEKKAKEYRDYRESCGITDPIMLDEIEEAYYSGMMSLMQNAKELVVDELDWHIYHFALGCLGVASGDRVKVVVIKQE